MHWRSADLRKESPIEMQVPRINVSETIQNLVLSKLGIPFVYTIAKGGRSHQGRMLPTKHISRIARTKRNEKDLGYADKHSSSK